MARKARILVVAELSPDGAPDKVTLNCWGWAASWPRHLASSYRRRWWATARQEQPRRSSPRGTDAVFTVEGAAFAATTPTCTSAALVKVIEEVAPAAVLLGHTTTGMDLGPRLAFALKDRADHRRHLAGDAGRHPCLHQAGLRGNAMAVYVAKGTPALATVRPGAGDPQATRRLPHGRDGQGRGGSPAAPPVLRGQGARGGGGHPPGGGQR